MALSAGSTFLLPVRMEWKNHLFIVLFDPNPRRETVIVNLTTAKPHSDRTTVLQQGEHPFINRETIANYLDATIADVDKLEQAIQGIGEIREPTTPELLSKLRSGLLASTLTKNKVKSFVKSQARP